MKRLLSLLLAVTMPALAEEEAAPATLSFQSGDLLGGKPVGAANGHLQWSSPLLRDTVQFPLAKLREMRIANPMTMPDSDHVAVVELTNGDVLRGRLLTLNAESLVLETPYAGTLTIRRVMMKSLQIDELGQMIYAGPRNNLDGWVQSQNTNNWTLENDTLVTQRSGYIGREFELPDAIDLSFDLEWRNTLQLYIVFYSADPKMNYQKDHFELQLSQNSAWLRKRSNDGRTQETIGQQSAVPEFKNHEKGRIRILASRKTGQFRLLVNDRIAATWTDPDVENMPAGKAILFGSRSEVPQRISRIRLRPWDGTLAQDGREAKGEEKPAEAEKEKSSGQRIILRNGDIVVGDVGRVEDGKLRVTTKRGELLIPVNRMRNIDLGSDLTQLEEPKRMQGDVRVWHPDGGRITFRLDSINDGVMSGYSQTFGDAKFQLNCFEKVEFDYLRFHLQEDR